jgi:hypothetical protein
MLFASTVAVTTANPTIVPVGSAPTQVGSDFALTQRRPAVSVNPVDQSTFLIAYGEGSAIRVEERSTTTGALLASASFASGTTGYTSRYLNIAYNPAATGSVLAWGVGSETGVRFMRLDGSLAPVGGIVDAEVAVGDKPFIGFLSDGSFVLSFEGFDGPGNESGAVLARFDATGTQIGTNVVANNAVAAGRQNDAVVAVFRGGSLATDRVLVAWEDEEATRFGAGNDDVQYRVFDGTLTPVIAATPVPAANLLTPGGPHEKSKIGNPRVAFDAAGNYAVIYEAEVPGGGGEQIYGSFFSNTHTALSGADAVRLQSTGLAGRQQDATVRHHQESDSFLVNWGQRTSSGAFLTAWQSDGAPALLPEFDLGGGVSSNVRESRMDLVGNTGVAVWKDDSANNVYFRVFTVTTDTAASVDNWMQYR